MPRKKEVVSGTFVKYDAVVLGSGPAGEGAAMKLAKSGKRVAIVEMREQLGGNCTHVCLSRFLMYEPTEICCFWRIEF